MIKKVRIAVDHGNRNMKTCSRVFTTGLTIQDKKPARREKFLFYEGKYYVLSENRIPYQRDKTHDDRFFILTLFAIVKELEENPQIQPEDVIQVDLPIGLPPKHYAELCERYEAYFKRQGKIHDINYCGRTYHITIGEVMAFPQDYAAMMTMIEKLQQIPKVVGIDIGGFTTDYLLMRKGNPDMEACDSMEKGVITMYNKIISGINSEYDILLEESDIDSILQGNTEFYEEAVVRMTEGMVQDFVKDLLNSIRERGIDTKAAYTVFIGGGAKLLSHFLEESDRLAGFVLIIGSMCNVVLLEYYLNAKQIESEKKLQLKEMSLQYDYYVRLERDMDGVRRIAHDIRNHLEALRGSNDEKEKEEYIGSIENKLDRYESYYNTGNAFIDSILHRKKMDAIEQGIELKILADLRPFANMKNEDLSQISDID